MSLLVDYSQVGLVADEPEAKVIQLDAPGAEERLQQAIDSMKSEHVHLPFKPVWYEHTDAYFDNSPMQPFMVTPALIPYGSFGVIAGAPKVGKTDYMLNMFSHWASGLDFLTFAPARPLRICYVQCEVGYHIFRMRLHQMGIPDEVMLRGAGNFKFTDRFEAVLNPENIALCVQSILERFAGMPPDIIAIDPLRNVYDPGRSQGENSNDGMMYFIRNLKALLRDKVNEHSCLILAHHTRKQTAEARGKAPGDVFDSLSGASALRGAHDFLKVITRQDPNDESNQTRIVNIESRCAVREIPGMSPPGVLYTRKINGVYHIVNNDHADEDLRTLGFRQDREQKNEVILNFIYEEAKTHGRLYTREAIIKTLEDKFGLGSASTVRNRVDILLQKWKIKLTSEAYQYGDFKQPTRVGDMYLVVYDTILPNFRIVLPTHCKSRNDNGFDLINDNRVWQLNE